METFIPTKILIGDGVIYVTYPGYICEMRGTMLCYFVEAYAHQHNVRI
jgi:hypothetical protein